MARLVVRGRCALSPALSVRVLDEPTAASLPLDIPPFVGRGPRVPSLQTQGRGQVPWFLLPVAVAQPVAASERQGGGEGPYPLW